ncbi:GntR family transcriptional regulator [Paracoccus beibuensis]|uniref:GntR family transcriptional regulator n=1 Tax=Paracoccus beibuensis TaxID=547602 RepID=UPI00223F9E3A|nr:GntR family transcriptional regulator [Paracoccus beibuensis]
MVTTTTGTTPLVRSSGPDLHRKRLNTWQAIHAEVLRRIRSGDWPPGELIPTEQMLAVELGCARATVNRALRELADSGIIERRRKVGTRVTASSARRTTLRLPTIRNEIETLGARASYALTSCETTLPNLAAMRALHVGADEPLLLVLSRFSADDRPHCCEAIWLNPRVADLPDAEVFALEPPQEWLSRNLPVTQSDVSIIAEAADEACARSLEIEPGTPVLTIERVNTLHGTPVSFARHHYPPQHRLVFDI